MSAAGFEIVACGDDALRVLCGEGAVRHNLSAHLRRQGGWTDIVPGKFELTVIFDPHAERMTEAIRRLRGELAGVSHSGQSAARRHTLPARFGGAAGPDLPLIADRLSRSAEEVISILEAAVLRVDMLGFTPGFAYLTGIDASVTSERLANPRPRVPAGSIGLITGQVGLYALDGPGGWPIIGKLSAPLFDRSQANPFLLSPGDEIVLLRTLGA